MLCKDFRADEITMIRKAKSSMAAVTTTKKRDRSYSDNSISSVSSEETTLSISDEETSIPPPRQNVKGKTQTCGGFC